MKSLIFLLMLIGCGHQEPESIDLQDDDGDHIANAYEAENQKSIAQVPTLGKIRGELIVRDGKNIIAAAEIQNWQSDERAALSVLRGERKNAGTEEFFRESHGLKLVFSRIPEEHTNPSVRLRHSRLGEEYKIVIDPEKHDHKSYALSVEFSEGSEQFESLEIIHDGKRHSIIESNQAREIPISGKLLRYLYNKNSFLEVTRNESENQTKQYIKEKCRKVYVSEGDLNDVFFLAKSKSLQFLKDTIGIREALTDSLSGEVLRKSNASFGIYSRSVQKENYHVIMRSKTSVVQKFYLDENKAPESRLERHDGNGNSTYVIDNNSEEDKVYFLNVKALGHSQRTFRDYTISRDFGRERDYSCYIKKIEQSGVTPIASTAQSALSEFLISVNGKPIDLSLIQEVQLKREDSHDLVLGLALPPGKTIISLRSSQLGTQQVGDYESSYGCKQGHRSPVSVETYFGVELHGFFEE